MSYYGETSRHFSLFVVYCDKATGHICCSMYIIFISYAALTRPLYVGRGMGSICPKTQDVLTLI